ncbi:hypothetical protein PoB_007599500 [Plakobranchus ocellatus]|uniref:Uncharacterized protein n=1 Tax=Plakobranchus ocellatus TaxID=259542 RepID=A0AAV4DZQ7_9GAST|nr:hypothetical protein PoB_007599500 [Plakobranchus ocellatus]
MCRFVSRCHALFKSLYSKQGRFEIASEASDSSDIKAPKAIDLSDIEAPEVIESSDVEAPWIPDSSAIETPTTSQMELNNIKLPKRAPKWGRPKGAEVTVIGLPKRKKGHGSLKPYKDLSSVERGRMILHWIVADADPSELQDLFQSSFLRK